MMTDFLNDLSKTWFHIFTGSCLIAGLFFIGKGIYKKGYDNAVECYQEEKKQLKREASKAYSRGWSCGYDTGSMRNK